MKSVLLGGLKVFLINDGGFPLSAPGGRAKFFKAGTSTPETVYSDIDLTEGTALGPVVYTDALGALPAIWLKTDRLYKVVVEQKVSDDPEVWAVLWEVDNVGEFVPASSEVAGAPSAVSSSITQLKELDHSEHTTATVLGYYAPGDWGTPSTFVWDGDSTLRDDGGSVIRPNDVPSGDAGRWLQVFTGDVLDVRKFGAIPDLTENSDVTAKVVNAINYAQRNSTRSRPLTVAFLAPGKYEFGGDFDFTQYADFVDLSDNSHHKLNWLICEDVVFKGDNSDFTLSSNTVCLTREALIEGTSATLSIEGGGSIKVDPAWWGDKACSVSDCYVECHSVTTNNKRFERCVVNSNRMFGAGQGYMTLVKMNFREEWFASDFDWSHIVLDDTVISVNDCFSADSYIAIKNAQGDYNYGDLGEQTLHDATFFSGALAENFAGTVTLLGDAEIYNATGTITLQWNAPSSLNLVDCWLTIVPAQGISASTIQLRRGHLSGTGLSVAGTVLLENVQLEMPINATGGTLLFNNCVISAPVSHQGNPVSENIRNCVFNETLTISGTGQDALVNATWHDNVGLCENPILIDRTNLDQEDSHHTYTYSGNTGTFMKETVRVAIDPQVEETHSGSYEQPTPGKILFYVKGNEDIIMAYSAAVVPSIGLFHVGSDINCAVKTWWKVGYQTFVGGTELYNHYSFYDEMTESEGNSSNWSAGYRQLPITGRLDSNDPTVTSCHVVIEVSRA